MGTERSRLTKEVIVGLVERGLTYQEIGALFLVSRQRVHQIFKGYISLDRAKVLRVFRRMGNRCTLCTSVRKLRVHYLDGNTANQDETNLTLLCEKCKKTAYQEERDKFGMHKRPRRGPRIVRKCNLCGAEKEQLLSQIPMKFCSRRCASQGRWKTITM